MLWSLVLSMAAVVAATPPADDGQIWAVLVAGSYEYYNYRHQADICHAYQIFYRHGVPDSNIIVMMYDDIANNDKNPKKGVIINKPGGPNVYGPKKVNKDYIKDQVTPENFINVITGNAKAMNGVGSGKVLKSGPKDHVFIYFADHGGTGLIAFPDRYLYAKDLIKALKKMHASNMYDKLVFYMEACESGSMFNKILPRNLNIFATTAATPYESSYACYWDDTVQAYLGDEYSVAWMEDIDSEEHQSNMTTETLKLQFQNVVKRVKESHPSMYGHKQFQTDHVTDYIGQSKDVHGRPAGGHSQRERPQDSVSVRDVLLHTLERRMQLAATKEDKAALQKEKDSLVHGREQVDELIGNILDRVTHGDLEDRGAVEQEHRPLDDNMMSCYTTLVDTFNNHCVNLNKNTYVLSHLYKFANLCHTQYSVRAVLGAFYFHCNNDHRQLTQIH